MNFFTGHMTGYKISITTHNVEHTRLVGQIIGEALASGILLALTGDLGSGKTAFIQGLAKGLEVSEKYYINSPTYTLINEYQGRIHLVHADLYRLNTVDDVESIGLYDMIDDDSVVAVEWADRMDKEDFPEYLDLTMDIVDDNTRTLAFRAHGEKPKMLIGKLETCFREHKWL